MRLREAVLADLPRLLREAERFGYINIQEGTKGGRSGALAPRWVEVTARAKAALDFASLVSPAESRNLLTRRESYASFLNNPIRHARRVIQEQGLKGFHELRASYACERYSSLTGHSPSQRWALLSHRPQARSDGTPADQLRARTLQDLRSISVYRRLPMIRQFDMSLFMCGVLSGSPASRRRHISQAKVMQTAIAKRWQNATPWEWKLKHVQWFLNVFLINRAPSTHYRYVLTTKLILKRMEKIGRAIWAFPP